MGISTLSLNQLDQAIAGQGWSYRLLRMLELGNQHLHLDGEKEQVAKPFFKERGVTHISIDLNGQDGAMFFDLCLPFVSEPPSFDVVTDFGTAEHVGDLYQCLKNCHEACRPGGLMMHVNPLSGNWPNHALHYFTRGTWKELAKQAGYEVLYLAEHPAMGNAIDGNQVHAILRKPDDPEDQWFPDRAAFASVPIFTI